MASIIKADTLQSTTANVFVLNSSGTEYARFDSDGDLGIGTASPSSRLHVYQNAAAAVAQVQNQTTSLQLQVNDGVATGAGVIYLSGAYPLTLWTNGSERMRINSSGNLGIGTTSPSSRLEIVGVNPKLTINANDSVNGRNATLSLISGTSADPSGTCQIMYGASNSTTAGTLTFVEGDGTERMRISAAGDLLVGVTANIGGLTAFGHFANVNAGAAGIVVGNAGGTSTTNTILFTNSNGIVGGISTSGSATSFNTSSDYRLKNTIAPMTGALDKVALLNPCTYKWNVDGSDGQGFIAHELQEVIAGCVTGEKDAVETYIDEDGKEATRPIYQGVDTSFLVATLTAAIQEQQALITQLQADVAALKAK